jgi:hypothetical protein
MYNSLHLQFVGEFCRTNLFPEKRRGRNTSYPVLEAGLNLNTNSIKELSMLWTSIPMNADAEVFNKILAIDPAIHKKAQYQL